MTLWNFLKYNVAGGGDSSLYGVESSTFYLRNALTNLNLVVPLALLVPLSALFLMYQRRGWSSRIPDTCNVKHESSLYCRTGAALKCNSSRIALMVGVCKYPCIYTKLCSTGERSDSPL